jgi:hypothetical protein
VQELPGFWHFGWLRPRQRRSPKATIRATSDGSSQLDLTDRQIDRETHKTQEHFSSQAVYCRSSTASPGRFFWCFPSTTFRVEAVLIDASENATQRPYANWPFRLTMDKINLERSPTARGRINP